MKKKLNILFRVHLFLFLCCSFLFSEETKKNSEKETSKEVSKKENKEDETYQISAWGWLTYGRVQESYWDQNRHGWYNYNDEWLNNVEIGYSLKRKFSDNSWGKLHVNHPLFWPAQRKNTRNFKGLNKTVRTRILEASIYLNYLEKKNITADMRIGYFSFKYNPQARNLGEYLFRSTPYPQYLISGFELADKVKIPGVKFGFTLFNSLKQEILIRSETEMPPLYDFSFTYLVSYQPAPWFNISTGVDMYRVISADEEKTTPSIDTLSFKPVGLDQFFTYYMDSTDTIPATFAGTKLMARYTFDPKPFFPSSLLGKEDLKIYGEATLLGTKNYVTWHENWKRRAPVMGGFNLPTFKFLDVLAFEVEYFANHYANSANNIWDKRTPLPYLGASVPTSPDDDNYKNKIRDNWKWSLYASRKAGKFLRFSAQVANDHSTRYGDFGLPIEDITQTPKDWYWMFRVMYYI